MRPGSRLLAWGYALGFPGDLTLTTGSFSGLRSAKGVTYVQTDTALNHGNSGGPLFDQCGQVVGVVDFGLRDTQGLNFAIASSNAEGFIQLYEAGKLSPPTPAPVDVIGSGSGGAPASTSTAIVATAATVTVVPTGVAKASAALLFVSEDFFATGLGYTPNDTTTVTWSHGGIQYGPEPGPPTDAGGGFNARLPVTGMPSNNHTALDDYYTITVSDSHGRTASATVH